MRTLVGRTPLAEGERSSRYEDVQAEWLALPANTRRDAMQWVNRWRAVGGGFSVTPGVDSHGDVRPAIVEPARMVQAGEGRGARRAAERLIAELKARPEMADAVQASTILVWFQTQTQSEGETAQ